MRQARQYTSEPVTDDIITELLEIARWTGSSRNTQPWHFIAITDKEILRQISQLRTPINWVAEAPLGIAIVLDGDAALSEAYDEGRVTERLMIGAHVLGLNAGVAWYGRLVAPAKAPLQPAYPVELAPHLKVPVLGLYGGADAGISVESVEQMRAALKAAGNTASEIVLYDGAPHAFYADYRPSYRKEPAEDGWKRCLAWLQSNGVA